MTSVQLHLDRPSYAEVENRVRHLLRDLFGFVPLDIGREIAAQLHQQVTEYQDGFLRDLGEMEEA